ncbi:phosphatidylinositol-glycan biosynthesis class S protein-domain-containing protein [Aspergillus lucknowensis]|uniref:Phosphatidylinositol-glycan biosynthesis class S protein-domain-containing protein n=1 Tax=Aspergillus lucknowensis TaxID=176173 RepID=A0ABR4LJF8_9EURO
MAATTAIRDIVSDPSLLPVLDSAAETRDLCQKLLSLLDPSITPDQNAESPQTVQKHLFALLAQLRGQSRDAIFRVRDTKQRTAEARQEIDRLHLQLQNLYYEQRHLTGEIAACESYDHKYRSLPLIPLEEFLELHPEHRESSEHELMEARINHEHAEREKLEQARQELLKRKQALITENNKRKDDLASLDQDLERFIDVRLLQSLFRRFSKRNTSIDRIDGVGWFHSTTSSGFGTSLVCIKYALSIMSEKHEDQGVSQTLMTPKTSASSLPPPEKPSAIQTRFRVVAAFWAVILFLGFPIWWKTTSIYRAELPLEEMLNWAGGKSCRPVFPVEIRFDTPSLPEVEAQQLLRTTQHTLDDLNDFSAHHLRLKLADEEVQEGLEKADTALTVRLLAKDGLTSPLSELQPDTTMLEIFYPPSQIPPPSSSNSPLSSFIAGELQRLFAEEKATVAHILSNNAIGTHASSPPPQNSQAQQISPQLAESITKRLRRSMKYAETYHLTFSLFTPGPAPSSWDIESTVQDYISPVVQALSPISNFTIDTQVQLYATFSPTAPAPEYDETQSVWTLKEENLSAFINAAEWPLNPSIGTGPTINFILYVPAPSQSPLVVKESRATSWIIPQWGGVFILNPLPPTTQDTTPLSNPSHLTRDALRPAFLTFSHQLLSLLGTPSTPVSLPFRLQTLIRIRAATLLLSASSTMGSLARLTESLPSIPIPATVASSVSITLSHLSSSCESLRNGRFQDALASARVAETEAERSFFEKSMVGQVYFPDEHKVAVYLPLLGPIGVPLILGLLKEIKRIVAGWKGRKSAAPA